MTPTVIVVALAVCIFGACCVVVALIGGGNERHTRAYCPECLTNLCENPSVLVNYDDEEFGKVEFRCSCGRNSQWDFDAPVPLLLSSTRRTFSPQQRQHLPSPQADGHP